MLLMLLVSSLCKPSDENLAFLINFFQLYNFLDPISFLKSWLRIQCPEKHARFNADRSWPIRYRYFFRFLSKYDNLLLFTHSRGKMVQNAREKALQLERKRKAAQFLAQLAEKR
jgi:hypothetical protein